MLALYAKEEKKKSWKNVCSVIWSNLFSKKELQTIPEGLDAFFAPLPQYSVKQTFVLGSHPYKYRPNCFLFAQGYISRRRVESKSFLKCLPPIKKDSELKFPATK